jgi:hypothetical protein
VTLDQLGNLALKSVTSTQVIANLSTNPAVGPGSYLLTLSSGSKASQFNEFWLTLGTLVSGLRRGSGPSRFFCSPGLFFCSPGLFFAAPM